MAGAHRLPDADRVGQAASEWIARLNADDVSDDDRAHCDAWRSVHPAHARTYDSMYATWRVFTAAGPLVRAVAFGEYMSKVAEDRHPHALRWIHALFRRVGCRR